MGKKEEEFRADLSRAMNVRANLAYTLAGKYNTIGELEKLADWVLNGMAAQKSVNDEIDEANKELDAKLKKRKYTPRVGPKAGDRGDDALVVKRPYTKKPGVKYGRASWGKKKASTAKKRKYTKRDKAFWAK